MSESASVAPANGSAATARGAVHEQQSPGRLVVQRGVFSGPTPRVKDSMYARITSGSGHRERFALHLDKGAVADTDAYFGRFAAAYYQRWTTVDRVEVRFGHAATGRGRALLCASDSGGNVRVLETVDVDGDGTATMSAKLDAYLDGGSLWLQFEAIDGRFEIRDLEWTVAAPSVIRPAAIAICTFNRADDCAQTVAAIAGDEGMTAGIDAVYVVDQGTDHVSDRELFAEVAKTLGDKLVYIRQPNLGGAGGFTRGIYEVSAVNEHANVILMDDDILCEPETVLRMNAFANVTTEPMLVGAQMLYLMNPQNLHVGAEEADLSKIKAGEWAANSLHDANMIKRRQNKRVDAGYNAWWSCLIPGEVISRIGLPLPVFFQWDDIEYGIRARAAGFITVTLPNAGVWHADFHWKDRDDWAKYFSVRNSLIASALHSDFDTKALSVTMGREISQFLVSMQYGLAHTMLRGIEDFLFGPEVLEDGGHAVLGAIRQERSCFPETVKHPADAIPGIRSADLVTRIAGPEPDKDREDLVLAKRAAMQWLGRTQHGIASIPASESHWWHVSLFDHAVVTDASQSGVRVRRRDKEAAKEITARMAKVLKQFREQGSDVQRRYREAVPRLTSRENWERLYEK
ncbi:glycosyltransferase [Prescottella agglutinans]|uniref:Galactofuranosylgalactofuranosylrhamnosyl-N-acetylglucosaminyl-diphospho-decaprenol beta-1,5/1,6-galactofuranosyltransferase n=1 Tax=Prescottella agglutinans TaxID=1644129 RepID=A0ABT6MEA2_9NOCA|nr:glycosyltransferase [Prescottella agglutinans]MDH6282607.1 galactofuranosylgalactofuranosylrhamnosyl-N-acetylglucosaminyl-diphospho-decaprenol beta-1,5/1,6-galactofuranosyltransferase [Prescottella agglutinans]